MSRSSSETSRLRALKSDPASLSLRWLIHELVKTGMITATSGRSVADLPVSKDGTKQHPLVIAAAQEWPDRRSEGRKLTLEALTQWLASRVHLPYVRIDPLKLDVANLTSIVPYAYALRSGILPIKTGPAGILFAVKDPFAMDWVHELEPTLKLPLKRVCANPLDIDRYLVEFYSVARSIKITGEERSRRTPSGLGNLEQLTELSRAGKLSAEDHHVVGIVDWLLQYAFDSRASDIHIEPRRDTGNVRFRIDGHLHDVYQFPAPVMPAITNRIKILARMDVAERRRPQDGRIRTRSPNGREIELRVSVLPTAFGEKLVLRIFNPDVAVQDFGRLGFSPEETKIW
jgi:general secretion pathway protein E